MWLSIDWINLIKLRVDHSKTTDLGVILNVSIVWVTFLNSLEKFVIDFYRKDRRNSARRRNRSMRKAPG